MIHFTSRRCRATGRAASRKGGAPGGRFNCGFGIADRGSGGAAARGRLALVPALAAVLFLLSAARADEEVVRLAGVFNNWNTSDDACKLAKVGDRLELVRYWPCGEYEFKFVFGGTWERHLGDTGGGKLGQPGENIKLPIPQSGEYVVWLNLEEKTWDKEKRPPSRPHAIIQTPSTFELEGGISLSGAASLAVAGKPIREYKWEFNPVVLDHEGKPLAQASGGSPYQHVIAPKAGVYQLRLTVSDGDRSDTATAAVEVGEGWELHENLIPVPNVMTQERVTVMLPLQGGRWAAPIHAQAGEERLLHVEKPHRSPPSASRPANRKVREQRIAVGPARLLAVYDPKTDELSLLDSGWHESVYVPKEDSRLPKDLRIERVELVGDFNKWQAGSIPLFALQEGREVEKGSHRHRLVSVFRRILELPDGVYHYKILVNGCIWLEDQNADPRLREPDNRGGFNSGVLVGLDGTKLEPAKPNHIAPEPLKHDPASGRYFTPISDDLALLTLRTQAGDVEQAELVRAGGGAAIPLRRVDSQDGFDYWSAQVFGGSNGASNRDRLQYAFRLRDGDERVTLGARGVVTDGNEPDYFKPDVRMSFQTPDWAKKAVWYQIFPERFRNGDPSNDPPRTVPWTHEWFKPYKGESRNAETPKRRNAEGAGDFVEEGTFQQVIFDRRYGGDFQGIREKLPYLRDLGVTAIYFNPIFIAESLHKYDATDYRHLDDFFGVKDSLKKIEGETTDPATWQWSESDRVFLDFIKEAHRLGFKVVIDGVFNHVGRDFWAFKDVLKNKEKSPYADWFEIKSWEPLHYKAWDGDDGFLPVLKHDEAKGLIEPIREHLFAVTRRWMDPNGDGDPSDGIDGWRLDVASDINANFWRDWRKVVKSANPDAYIVAELWEESRAWLDGQTFDAVMNYPFARACQKFFVNQKKRIKPSEFDKLLRENLGWYLPQVNYVLQNLLDSHDTDRAASMFMNPDLEYDKANRLQDNGPNYNPAKPTPDCYEKLKLEVMFQMCFLGAPMVYYGDEVGMYGADDPSCRKPMYWEDLMPYDDPDERIVPGLRDHYRRMIAIHNAQPALQLGSFETLLVNDSQRMYAFARRLGDETIVVVLNNSDKPHKLNVPSPWPAEAVIVRLDDPASSEVVDPPADKPTARPMVRPIPGAKPTVNVVDGKLKGITLPPRSGAILKRAE